MSRFFAFGWLKTAIISLNRPSKSGRAGKQLRRARFTPRLEALEDRTLPSTFTVLNLADSGAGSLRQAVLSANASPGADVIAFAHGLHGTIGLTSGQLSITGDLSIVGPGENRLTVSGSNASRVFDIGAGETVTIADLTIANGATVGGLGGGGILNEAGATLTLTHTTLKNNTATAASNTVDVFGGGLLNEGTGTIAFSTFTGNQALGGGGSSFFGGSVGGGIDNFGGATLTITDSTFAHNEALGAAGLFNFGIGGALENNAGYNSTTPSTATISNCTFLGNVVSGGAQVTGNGGAIDNEGTGATITLINSTVRDNQSIGAVGGGEGRGGGIMYVLGSRMTVVDCVIANNVAVGGTGAAGLFPNFLDGRGIGGGIDNAFGSTLTVFDSTVTGNKALGGDGSTFGGTLATSNVADGDGGGIDNGDGGGGIINPGFNGPSSTLTIIDSTLSGNVARGGSTNAGRGGTGHGGGIVNVGSTLTVTDCTITDNLAHGGAGGSGYETGSGIGGGIAILAASTASITDSSFTGNSAVGAAGGAGSNGGNGVGGGIDVGTLPSPDTSTLSLSGSTLDHNEAQGGDGGHGANGGDGLGGGLAVQAGSRATLSNSIIKHNEADGGEEGAGGSDGHGMGGGVYNVGTFTVDILTVIKKNHASTSNDNVFP